MSKLISIMTSAPGGTLGDASATLKLIRCIRQNFTATSPPRINWYLFVENLDENRSKYDQFISNTESLGVDVYTYHLRRFPNPRLDAIKSFKSKPDLLIFFSSYQDQFEERELAKSYGILTLYSPEYDSKCYGRNIIATGLGERMRGIFFEPETTVKTLGTLNGIDQKLATDLGLLENPNADCLTPELVQQFTDKALLYMAYFNKSARVFNPGVNFSSYLLIVLHLALGTTHKTVNIITNTCDIEKIKEIFKYNPNLARAFKSLIYKTATTSHTIELNKDQSSPAIMIFDYFPLGQKMFSFLLGIADPFKAVTGNETFSEGIVANGLLFYQVMKWRPHLASSLLKRCEEYCGSKSVLGEYYRRTLNIKGEEFNPSDLASFIKTNLNLLRLQARELSTVLKERHNLYSNLAGDLEKLLLDPTRIHELFPDLLEDKGHKPKTEHAFFMAHYQNILNRKIGEIKKIRDKTVDTTPGKKISLSYEVANQIVTYGNTRDPDDQDILFEFDQEPWFTVIDGYYSFIFPLSNSDSDSDYEDDTVVHVRKHIIDRKLYEQQSSTSTEQLRPQIKKCKVSCYV